MVGWTFRHGAARDAMLSRLPFTIAKDLGAPRDGYSDPWRSRGSICRTGSLNRTLMARQNRIAAPDSTEDQSRRQGPHGVALRVGLERKNSPISQSGRRWDLGPLVWRTNDTLMREVAVNGPWISGGAGERR